jgi:hypothetical protein
LLNILLIPFTCHSFPSSMPMILRFHFWWGLWVIAYSQDLSCLTNNSSVFPLITISSSSSEILSSAYYSLLEWSSILFCTSVSFFFLRFSISRVMSFLLSIFIFNSFISLFMVFSISLWCLFRAPMISFFYFCVFSYSLFLLSWGLLLPPVLFGWPCLVTSLWISH